MKEFPLICADNSITKYPAVGEVKGPVSVCDGLMSWRDGAARMDQREIHIFLMEISDAAVDH